MQVGRKFNKGQVLAFNSNFFEQDLLYPSTVIMKNSMDVLVAYVEDADVHEDSCSVSPELAARLSTKTTYVRLITLDFIQEIDNVVKIGSKVMPDTPLMIIQDEITSSGGFDEKAYESLRRLSSQSPKSKYKGIVEKIEVFYHGEKEDMSPSIKSLAEYSDRELVQSCKASNRPVINGRVNDEYRSEGVPLALDRVEIKVYITSDISAGVADKGVLCNQMKTTIGEVFPGDIYTEQGQKVDIKFSYRSVAKRIVNSPMLIGAISTISRYLGKVVGNMKE